MITTYKFQAFLANRATFDPEREDPGPGDRETIRVDTHGFDPLYILFILVVLIDRNIRIGVGAKRRCNMAGEVIVADRWRRYV